MWCDYQLSGHLKETLKEFIERRVKLKLAESLAEHLAEKVTQDISDKEAKLRREYEDKMRRYIVDYIYTCVQSSLQ